MNDNVYDDMALEHIAKEKFGMTVDIDHVIARNVPVSHVATATLFLTSKKQLLLYINAHSKLLLGDVKKIVTRMGLVPELFVPPKGQPQYFDEIGREHYKKVFPGLSHPSKEDIIYYRTLAPYNPALVQIAEVKNGEVRQFDTDASSGWRVATKFAYRRIKTS
ncbi:hypothetical protein RAAC3_TM7C00001G0694 [Candidatus Saccharibacteria bacterium RAAC3_TM7_1]|nr:hypothetical protein RAAC3_TM7C00001G0694 [Candidatus Saccharibacteria bacterium RAAC3_TM7_1]HCZ28594.1 hypothetical protein [Candidatus Saccharibacteria bacterium]